MSRTIKKLGTSWHPKNRALIIFKVEIPHHRFQRAKSSRLKTSESVLSNLPGPASETLGAGLAPRRSQRAWTWVQRSKDGYDLSFTKIDPIPMKNVGRGPLECGESGVKVGDNDLGLMTSESGEKNFFLTGEVLLTQWQGCESGKVFVWWSFPGFPIKLFRSFSDPNFFSFFTKNGGKFKITRLAR